MSTSDAAVSIELKVREAGQIILDFRSSTGTTVTVESFMPEVSLREQRAALRQDLERFKAVLGGSTQRISSDVVSRALTMLFSRGEQIILNLFADQHNKISDVVDLFTKACVGWESPGWEEKIPPPLLLDVKSPLHYLVPVEILPFFKFEKPRSIEDGNINSLANAVNRFVGFSMIVRRQIDNTPILHGGSLSNVKGLPIKFFQNTSLRGVHHELDFFRNNKTIDLDGPWPENYENSGNFATDLAANLLDPTRNFARASRPTPSQIYHFACHCNTNTEQPEEYTLILRGTGWQPQVCKVTLRDLRAAFSAFERQNGSQARPLVFLNACGSSEVDPAGLASFPLLFLRYHHRGFIGTDTKIPDRFAAEFSKAFYTELLRGTSIGKAVYRARWKLLERYHNPLGILYSIYADPELTVEAPVLLQESLQISHNGWLSFIPRLARKFFGTRSSY